MLARFDDALAVMKPAVQLWLAPHFERWGGMQELGAEANAATGALNATWYEILDALWC